MNMTKEELLDQLIKRTRYNKVTPFIGSGFSINAGAPRGKDLITALIEEGSLCYNPELPEPSLRKVAQDFEDKEGRHELIELLSRLFNYEKKESADHKLLQKIPQFRNYFTSNYDTEIEDSYPRGMVTVVNSNQGCTYANSTPIRVYKIHGDLTSKNDPDSIVITENDYQRFYHREEPTLMCNAFVNACVETNIVFIGYSAEDENILKLVDMVDDLSKHNQRDMYLVAPNLSEEQIKNLEKRRIHYIDAYACEYLKKLVDSLYLEICQDFNDKKISSEILADFCHKHNLEPVFKDGAKKNEVLDLVPIGNTPKHEHFKMNVKCDPNQRSIIDAQPTEVSGFKIPTYEIVGKIKNEWFINDIRMGHPTDIAHFYFHPVCKVHSELLKIAGTKYRESVKCCTYRDKGRDIIDIDTPLYTLKIMEESNNNGHKTYNIRPIFKETYISSSQAINWMEILISIFRSKEFHLGDHGYVSNFTYDKNQYAHDRHMLYYSMVEKLEIEFDLTFTHHYGYTEERLIDAYLLHSFLSNKPVDFPLASHKSLGWEGTPNEPIIKCVSKKRNYWMETVQDLDGFEFNGMKFPLKFERLFIPKGKVTSIVATDHGTELVTFTSSKKNMVIEALKSSDDYQVGISLGY